MFAFQLIELSSRRAGWPRPEEIGSAHLTVEMGLPRRMSLCGGNGGDQESGEPFSEESFVRERSNLNVKF